MSSQANILFKPFPKQEEFIKQVFSGLYNICIYGGAIRGGKTFVGLGILIILCKVFAGSRWGVVRTDRPTMMRTTYVSFLKILPKGFVSHFDGTLLVWTFRNGSQILFFPENFDTDKDLDRFKGLEVNGFLLEEFNELQEKTFNKCIERAGTHFLPEGKMQPPPLIIATCNPADNWVKTRFYNKWKEGTLEANTLYYPALASDNPYIPQALKDNWKSLPEREYQRFVLGNWDVSVKEGDEFYTDFDFDKHLASLHYDPTKPLHLSFDENVLPYLALSIWQVDGDTAKMIDFIDGKNLEDACSRFKNTYADHKELVFIYGDATSQKADAKLPKSQNFFSVVFSHLQGYILEKRVPPANPSVGLRGAFINRVLRNETPFKIRINKYPPSVSKDYELDTTNEFANTKVDREGNKLKKLVTENGRSFQRWGHISDTLDYFICRYYSDEYKEMMFSGNDSANFNIPYTKTRNKRG